jgi:hypothetical protein
MCDRKPSAWRCQKCQNLGGCGPCRDGQSSGQEVSMSKFEGKGKTSRCDRSISEPCGYQLGPHLTMKSFIPNPFGLRRSFMYRPYPPSLGVAPRMSSLPPSAMISPQSETIFVRVGSVVRGRYQLLHRIGSGGLSTAWLVWDQQCVSSFTN